MAGSAVAVLKTLEEAVEFNRPYGTELIVMFAMERSYHESPLLVSVAPQTLIRVNGANGGQEVSRRGDARANPAPS